MRRIAGQAARHCAVLLHRLAGLALAIAVLGGAAVGTLSWRLSQGPLDLPWLTKRVEKMLNRDIEGHIAIGSAALAWEGFRMGVDRPLDIRLRGVSFTDPTGAQILAVPSVGVSLSLHSLLEGRVVPRALEVDQARINLVRASDGTIALVPGDTDEASAGALSLLSILTELGRPAATDRSALRANPLSQLQLLRIHDAALTVVDHQLGVVWRAPHTEIDLRRRPQGGVDGSATLSLALGNQQAKLTATATLLPDNGARTRGAIRIRARLTPVEPAAIASMLHSATPLAAIEVPVGIEADLSLDDTMALQTLHLALQAGVGLVHVADGVLPFTQANIVADITPEHIALRDFRLELTGHPGAMHSVVQATGQVERGADHLIATMSVALNQVDFSDLPLLWPMGVGRGARAWITQNITAGVARDGHVEVGLEATPDLSDVTLTRATGSLTGEGLTVSWLSPVPPITHGAAVLNIVDPDTLEIVVHSGVQELEPGDPAQDVPGVDNRLRITGGRMRITGIMQPHQFGTIDADIAGPVPQAIALLRDPRLRLLDKHPLPLNDPTGQMSGHLTVSVPLEAKVTMDDIAIHARAHLEDVHLGSLIAGRDLDNGVLDLDVTQQGLTLTGRAALAGVPASINASMDFRAGGPNQVLQRIAVEGQATARQLATVGLDLGKAVEGSVGLAATLTERRDGAGEIAVNASLTDAALTVTPIGWHKPDGTAMAATATVRMMRDRLTSIDDIAINGADLSASGSVSFSDGKPETVRINQIVLGRSQARATIRFPGAGATRPIEISMAGPSLDLSGHFTHTPPPPTTKPKPEEPSGPHWTLDARFDRVFMANDQVVTRLVAEIDSDGGRMQRLQVDGVTAPKGPFSVRITPAQGKRTVSATATNAGGLLAALDIAGHIQGGKLNVTGSYDDTKSDHPLMGTATIEDFRVQNAPMLARLLQAMTLYGLVEVMRGPGLGFTELVAPFQLTDDVLTLTDARAFSSSLGLTAKGSIDLDLQRASLDGTIVPAYFFNALLGNIPLVGRLFSPEQGGGVFAASYSVRGPLEDPQVSVNPLSALTPGFLRGVFGIF